MTPATRGALWMTGAIVSFSAMAVAGREMSGDLDTFEIMMYRSLGGLAIVCAVLAATGRFNEVRTGLIGLHMLRNTVHFTGQNLWFFAVIATPLAQVFALEFTTPLWVILLSPLFLGERLTPLRLLAVVVGFGGILIVARPAVDTLSWGMAAAAASAVFFAATTISTKRLTRTDSILCIMFWLTAIQLGLGLLASGYDGDIALPPVQSLGYVAIVALGGLVAHFCITTALSIASASVVAPVDFVRLPTIAVLGMLLYGEALDIWVFVGAAVIFGANYMNILVETRKNRVA